MAHVYEVHEAQAHLSKLLKLVEAGEDVAIVREGEAVARLVRADAELMPMPHVATGGLEGRRWRPRS